MSTRASVETVANPTLAWTLAAAWALFVLGLGADELSLERTSRFLGPLLQWLMPGISSETSDMLQFAIRKTAHVFEYAVLAFLTFRAFIASGGAAPPRAALGSWGLATLVAAADETRQSLSTTRLGSVADVGLDAVGAAVAVCLLLWLRAANPSLSRWLGVTPLPDAQSGDRTRTGPVK